MSINVHKSNLFLLIEGVEDEVLKVFVEILIELKQPIAFLHWLIEMPIVWNLQEKNIQYYDKKMF